MERSFYRKQRNAFISEIVDWGIFDQNDECQPTINNNDIYTVKVKIRFNKEVDEPIFAMSVKDIKGLELGGVNTKAYKVLTGTYYPGDEVVVEYRQQFPLAPERYAFSFGCTKFKPDGSLQVFDRKYDALLFEIVGYRDCLGIIDFKTDINIIRSNNNEG